MSKSIQDILIQKSLSREDIICLLKANEEETRLIFENAAQVKTKFVGHVACTLELLENDIVHLGAGLGQGRCENRERTATLDVPGRAEEPLRLLEGDRKSVV